MTKEEFYVPLYEKIWLKRPFQRVKDTFILLLLLLLLGYRFSSVQNFTFPWFLASLCESWFTFTWIVILNIKWSPLATITHPHRLLQLVPELPPVDLFVPTADPVLEPPIITVNTVLSLLALDYPPNKLACYVSDDGCSPLTFYALVEASKFAKVWVPFCKKYNIQVRAPFRYFSEVGTANSEDSPEFRHEWSQMKDTYDYLNQKVTNMCQKPSKSLFLGELAIFSNTEKRNHPSIIKVILDNKEGLSSGLPQLVYISREKRPQYAHNYKAGAMNVLTRVSALMTNAPFILNVDCDMFVNNPKIVLHAMCILMDAKKGKDVAFVQCFQQFYDGIKDDPFGNQWVAAFEYIVQGMAGLRGPFFAGSNTFHRRKALYGLSPIEAESDETKVKLEEKILMQQIGRSQELIKSVAHVLKGSGYSANDSDISPSNFIEAATQVASCEYEFGTSWGNKRGWLYGSVAEDVPTGLNIHRKGWRSECCTPDQTAFTGCAPRGLPSTMIQQKRWTTGLTTVFFGKHSPVMGTLFGKIQFRHGLSYCWITNWPLRSVFQVSYTALPSYCIITNTSIYPKGIGLLLPIVLFLVYSLHTLQEYLSIGLSMRRWWNNQRMSMITTTSAWLLGFLSGVLKLLGLADNVFDITQKEQSNSDADGEDANAGRFTFDESPVFVVCTTILLVQLMTLAIWFLGLQVAQSENGSGPGELISVVYLIVCYWPFLKGLFGRGKYGVPLSSICKSAMIALAFVHLCRSKVLG